MPRFLKVRAQRFNGIQASLGFIEAGDGEDRKRRSVLFVLPFTGAVICSKLSDLEESAGTSMRDAGGNGLPFRLLSIDIEVGHIRITITRRDTSC